MASDLRWNPVSVNFNDSAAFMNGAGNSFSRAGTVFGELRKQILDQEQKRIENEYKERALQQTIDAENRLHEYRLMTAQEAERHNKATEAYYKGMLDYHNHHTDIVQQLGESRNRLLAEQLKFRGEHSDKTREIGGRFLATDLFPAMSESDALEAKPSATALAPTDLNERLKKYRALSEQYENIDDPTDEQTAAFYREVGNLGLTPEIINKSSVPSTDIVTKGNPVDDLGVNEGLKYDTPNELGISNPNGNDSSTNTSKGLTLNLTDDSRDYDNYNDYNNSLKWASALTLLGGPQFTANNYRLDDNEQKAENALKRHVPTYVYGDNLIEDPQGFYTNYDEAIKKITEQKKSEDSTAIDFNHLTNNEKMAMTLHSKPNDAIRNFGDRWYANTFFGSADTITLSASATENEAQYRLRSIKELAALKQIYSSGNPELQQFVLGRLKQGAKSPHPDVAAKCKLGYMYLNSALTSKEYGTSVGGLQALDSMYINSRFPTKESAADITNYQQKRTDQSKEKIEQGRQLTRLIEDPLDFSKFGGNKAGLENAEYRKLRNVVNVANHTDIPKEWGYGPTNKLARAAALRLTLNQLGTKEKWFFGNVVNANDSALEFYQHAKDLDFFKKSTTEGNLFHDYYRTLYRKTPSEIRKFMESVQSSK